MNVTHRMMSGLIIPLLLGMGALWYSIHYAVGQHEAALETRLEALLMASVKDDMASNVEIAASMASSILEKGVSKEDCLEILREQRFGGTTGTNRNYVWVHTYDPDTWDSPVMLMHPYMPDLIGKSLADLEDTKSVDSISIKGTTYSRNDPAVTALPTTNLFVAMNRELKSGKGEAFLEYYWPKPNDPTLRYRKISYVRLLPSLGWVIGSGEYLDYIEAHVGREGTIFRAESERLQNYLLLLWFGIAAIILLAAYVIARKVSQRIQSVSFQVKRVATGDLTELDRATRAAGSDEIGDLARSIGSMTQNLARQIRAIQEDMRVLQNSAGTISGSTSDLATRATEMAVSVSESTSSSAQIRDTCEMSGKTVTTMASNAHQARIAAEEGTLASSKMFDTMDVVQGQMTTIAEAINSLGAKISEVEEIVFLVEDLTDQSDLLAINAAIEASKSKAGTGGFAVVTEEIRGLAEQSKNATRRIRTILEEVKRAAVNAISATDCGCQAVADGVDQAGASRDALDLLSRSVAQAETASRTIQDAFSQQLEGTGQVAASMEFMKQASEQTAETANQLASVVQEIHGLTERLRQTIDHYSI